MHVVFFVIFTLLAVYTVVGMIIYMLVYTDFCFPDKSRDFDRAVEKLFAWLWPISIPIGTVYFLYRLSKSVRKDIRTIIREIKND